MEYASIVRSAFWFIPVTRVSLRETYDLKFFATFHRYHISLHISLSQVSTCSISSSIIFNKQILHVYTYIHIHSSTFHFWTNENQISLAERGDAKHSRSPSYEKRVSSSRHVRSRWNDEQILFLSCQRKRSRSPSSRYRGLTLPHSLGPRVSFRPICSRMTCDAHVSAPT